MLLLQILNSEEYKSALMGLNNAVDELLNGLSTNSTPFYSNRYQGHMNWDTTLPGMIGYMAAVPFNPNNVAYESSPYTSELEIQVIGVVGQHILSQLLHAEQHRRVTCMIQTTLGNSCVCPSYSVNQHGTCFLTC